MHSTISIIEIGGRGKISSDKGWLGMLNGIHL